MILKNILFPSNFAKLDISNNYLRLSPDQGFFYILYMSGLISSKIPHVQYLKYTFLLHGGKQDNLRTKK